MTRSAVFDRLRPGRDGNDSWWLTVQGRSGWQAGPLARGLGWDAAVKGLTLAPLARPDLAADWLASAAVAGPDGTLYRADPETDALLWHRPCTAGFVPVPWIGGRGHATSRFDTPVSVAVDRQGLLYVADAGNGRVQVIDPVRRDVVAVLQDGLHRPVHAAIDDAGRIAVADAATGALHLFHKGFGTGPVLPLRSLDPWTGDVWPDLPRPRPLAVAVRPGGSLVAFDPRRPLLWHMTCDGRPLPALPWPGLADLPPGWAGTPARHEADGEVVVGPLDGGQHDLAWHRLLIEADLPPGTRIAVQTFAANTPGQPLAWAPRLPVALPRAKSDRGRGEFDRLVLPNSDLWSLWRLGQLRRDRPLLHRLDGDGPDGAASFTLPAPVAAQLCPGDLVALETPAGARAEARVAAISDGILVLAASGPAAAFAAPPVLRLIAREDTGLPFGAVDLGFLADPATLNLSALVRDGSGQAAPLPHALAAFLRPGDVVALTGDHAARFEVCDPEDAGLPEVTVTLDAPLAGFGRAQLSLEQTVGRLRVQEPLPALGDLARGSAVRVIDPGQSEAREVAWIDAPSGTIWLERPLDGAVTAQSWTNARFDAQAATDRGRYLWLRLTLAGAALPAPGTVGPPRVAQASPVLRGLRVLAPRPSLLSWLPALFSQGDPVTDPPGANFLDRFLSLFEGQLTAMEAALDSVQRLLNPQAADDQWLAFVAAWIDLAFDPSWPVAARRQLVIEGAALQAGAGTPAAMARYLEIYTGAAAGIVESFRRAPPAPIQLGARGALGVAPLAGAETAAARLAHDFTVHVTLPQGRDRAASLSAIHRIVETVKPAHTTWRLETGGGAAGRVGMDTAVDGTVIPGPRAAVSCDGAAEDDPPPGSRDTGFRLGGRLGRPPAPGLSEGVGR